MRLKHLSNCKIEVQKENFDVNFEIKSLTKNIHKIGAVVSFLGLVRDLGTSPDLKFLEIEHYPDMSKKVLRQLCGEAAIRWDLEGITLIHRVGKLYPAENIVLLIIASGHRTEAFNASEFIMDFL